MVEINQGFKDIEKSRRVGVLARPGFSNYFEGGRDAHPTVHYMTELPEEDLVIYRRKLPHWRLAGSVYFVTWRLEFTQPEMTPDERAVIMAALKHFDGQRYDLYAVVVMHNHVHALVKPVERYRLQAIVQSWKSFTAHKFSKDHSRRIPIWQQEYFDRIVRDEKEFFNKLEYIINNPWKTWPDMKDYPWLYIKEDMNP